MADAQMFSGLNFQNHDSLFYIIIIILHYVDFGLNVHVLSTQRHDVLVSKAAKMRKMKQCLEQE